MGDITGRRARRGRREGVMGAVNMAEAAEIIVSEARGERREAERKRSGVGLCFFAGTIVGAAVGILLSGGAFVLWLIL